MTEWKDEKEKEKTTPFTKEQAGKEQWHPAEIRRRDIQKLLNNTKELATMYSDLLEDWDCDLENLRSNDHLESKEDFRFTSRSLKTHQNEEDPWI